MSADNQDKEHRDSGPPAKYPITRETSATKIRQHASQFRCEQVVLNDAMVNPMNTIVKLHGVATLPAHEQLMIELQDQEWINGDTATGEAQKTIAMVTDGAKKQKPVLVPLATEGTFAGSTYSSPSGAPWIEDDPHDASKSRPTPAYLSPTRGPASRSHGTSTTSAQR